MFAPPVTKAAASSTGKVALRRTSTPSADQFGDRLAQQPERAPVPGLPWDFSKVQLFPLEARASRRRDRLDAGCVRDLAIAGVDQQAFWPRSIASEERQARRDSLTRGHRNICDGFRVGTRGVDEP